MRTPSGKQRRATTVAAAAPDRPIRLCDSCYRLRARWYCASDDAFLCQDCDATVHSTNHLASRHHRLRLNSTFSSSPSTTPGWHNGFKRKPRTPRPHHHSPKSWLPAPVIQPIVPEIDTLIDDEDDKEEEEEEEEESQLLYQVPIFNPDLAEFRSPPPPLEDIKPAIQLPLYNSQPETSADGLLPTEVELAEFTADMESLLGPETMEINFDCVSPAITGDDDVAAGEEPRMMRVGLRLDYEAVIAEWSTHGSSPWTDSQRPMFGPGYQNWWPDEYMMVGGATWSGGGVGIIDGGREARVSRYREKRRRRLFSKKIRYEVRKLNAEKRPRMKGRFVKRAAVAAARAF